MSKSLAGKLNNRIEIWGPERVETDIGDTYEDKLIKKIWADIMPMTGSVSPGPANTLKNTTKFKIRVRKTEISTENWIIFKGVRYEIDCIYQDFNKNAFLDIEARLKGE